MRTSSATKRNGLSPGTLGLPVAGLWCLVPGLSAFGTMCLVALSLFGLIKAQVLLAHCAASDRPSGRDMAAWFIAWPGLDARAFFESRGKKSPVAVNWLLTVGTTALGAILFFLVAPRFLVVSELAAGWIALIGVVLILHFGTFRLLALFWQQAGRGVKPIMNAPIAATSVSDFWSKRWNLAFRDYAYAFLFRPLSRRYKPVTAVLVGYLFSGIIHELAISLPARGGYGLPTLYFMVQGVAILVERAVGSQLKSGVSGRLWTVLVTVPGAFLLFHPPFVERVVVPLVRFFATEI